jgi:hypothetical protein
MIRRIAFAAVTVLALAASGDAARGQGSMRLAIDLGDVLGSETICGLTYDQAGIAAFIEKSVPANDMSFTSNLRMMTDAAQSENAELSGSAKTAHCAQITRVARSYGFIK